MDRVDGVRTFWVERTDRERVSLRRYVHSDKAQCPMPHGYHSRMVTAIEERPAEHHAIGDPEHLEADGVFSAPSKDDPRWPERCDCGYTFQPTDHWQVFPEDLYSGSPDGKLRPQRDFLPGTMWNAWWLNDLEWSTGPDGISLYVRLPNGHDWCPDQEATNCDRTQWLPKVIDGKEFSKVWQGRTHYCWVRHGDPRTGMIHVDKNGNTCRAGAGSVISGKWHGFLHNGLLYPT